MTKKYDLIKTDTKVSRAGETLYRIKRISDNILGGYISGEHNLSHKDKCWVSYNAQVSGYAKVYGNAFISGNASISGNARVYGSASVYGKARIYGNAQVYDNAVIRDNARVFGTSEIFGTADVSGNAKISYPSQVVNIPQGLKWNFTMTPENIRIGCHTKPYEEWLKVTAKEAAAFGLSKELYKELYKSYYRLVKDLRKIMILNDPHWTEKK